MNELQQVLNDIKQDKNTNLLPGNLRDNVTCLGVEGTAEVPETIYKPSSYYYDSLVINDKVYSALYVNDWFIYAINDSNTIVCYYNNNKVCQFNRTRTDDVRISCIKLGTDYIIIIITQWNQRDNLVYKININGQVSQLNSINVNSYYSLNCFTRDGDLSIDGDLYRYNEDTDKLVSKYSLSGMVSADFRGLNNFLYDNLHNNYTVYNTIARYMYNSNSNTYSVLYARIADVDGVTYNGDKVVINGNIYQLGYNLEVGSLLKSNVIPHKNGDSGPVINWIDSSMCEYNGVLYNFDDDNNTFTPADDLPMHTNYVVNSAGYIYFKYNNTYILLKTEYSDVEVGYNYKGNYFPKSNIVFNSRNILQGNTYYTDVLQPVGGTMPNNGELNITPTTENQNIPKGYTSGGIVLGDENLKSENIKKDVSIFGVTGSLESSSGQIKLFETQEEMQADPDAKEGDLAVVYKYKFNNIVAETRYDVVYFPEVVVLNARVESPITIGNIFLKPYIRITSTAASFTMSGYTVTYTSEDGITYTRTDTLGNPLEGIYMSSSNWNDIIGYFVKTLEIYFGGVFRHNGEQYVDAPNQLTLNDASYLLTNISGYGPNGIVTGDDSIYTKLSTSKLDEYYANKYGATNEDKYLHPSITGITGINLKVIKKSNDSLNTLENGKYCNCNTIEVPLQYDNVLTNFFFSNKDFIFTVVAYTENDVQSLIVNKYNNALTLLETYTLEFPYTIKNCVLHNELLYIVYYDNSSKFRISVYNIQTQSEIQSQDLITTTSLANVILAYDEIAQLLYITTQIDSSNNNLYRYSYVNNSIETIFSTTGSNMEGGYASTCGTSSKHIYVTKGNTLYYYVKGSTTQTELLTLTNMSCTRELYSIEYNGIIYLAVGGCDSYSAGMNSVGNIYQLNDDMTYSLLYNGNSNYSLDILEINGNPCYCRDQYGYLDKSNWFTGSISEMDYVFPLATTTRKNIYVNNNILTIGWNSKTEINGYYTFNYVDTSSDINSLINLQNGDKSYVPVYCYASAKTKPLFDVSWNTLYNGCTNYDGTISPTEYNTALETSKRILAEKEEGQ